MVGGSERVVNAHNKATCTMLWQRELPETRALRIHGGVVVVPGDGNNILVLDLMSGALIHTLPSAGLDVRGVFVFDGLTSENVDRFLIF